MPIQKNQLHRLMRIAALLKENRYPNSKTLIEEFRRISLEEGLEIDCVKKTVLRDMKLLETEFGCPLAFDRAQNGYYLKHHGWDFIAPALLDENEMIASVIGARIAEEIFPAPVKNRIRNAVDALLQQNNPDFLDTANLRSLFILSGLYIDLNATVFLTVFTGWQERRRIKIFYEDYAGNVTSRYFEPHTLVFYQNNWYTKGLCLLKKAPRTFSLSRIKRAEITSIKFEPDKEIIRSVNTDDFLGFQKIKNVKLQITDHVKEKLLVSPLHSKQKFFQNGTVVIPAVSKETLFPFLLSFRGEAVLLKPENLREEIKAELEKMLSDYQ